MKVLDIYIIKKYLGAFLFSIVLITMVSIVIDLSEKMAKFLNESVAFKEVLMDYYLPFIPWINGLLWPLFALIAVVFFTSRMARNTEIVSIMACGVSYYRMLVPYLLTATFLAATLWFLKHRVIPGSTKIKNEFEAVYIAKSNIKTLSNDIHFYLSPDEKVYIRYYRARDSSAQTFRLEKYEEGRLVEVLKANRLKLRELPNKWTLEDYEEHRFDGLDEEMVVYKAEKRDTVFDFTPKDFVRYSNEMEMMKSADLKEYIDTEKRRGLGTAKKLEIELYRRTADPVTIIILTLIGVSISSRKERGGMGLNLALGVIFAAGFVVLSQFSTTFALNLNMSPMLGVWIPNILFSAVAVALTIKAGK